MELVKAPETQQQQELQAPETFLQMARVENNIVIQLHMFGGAYAQAVIELPVLTQAQFAVLAGNTLNIPLHKLAKE